MDCVSPTGSGFRLEIETAGFNHFLYEESFILYFLSGRNTTSSGGGEIEKESSMVHKAEKAPRLKQAVKFAVADLTRQRTRCFP